MTELCDELTQTFEKELKELKQHIKECNMPEALGQTRIMADIASSIKTLCLRSTFKDIDYRLYKEFVHSRTACECKPKK